MQNVEKINSLLFKLGLSKSEARLYLYCLSHGPLAVSRLAKACKLTRTNGYDVVKRLEEKGLVYNLGSLYGRQIKANSASHLQILIRQQQKELAVLEEEVKKSETLFDQISVPKVPGQSEVSYFRGKASMKQLLLMTLQAKTEILSAGSELDILESLGEEFLISFHSDRVKRKITSRALRPGTKRGSHKIFHHDSKHYREVKVRGSEVIKLKSVLMIWNDNVAFCSFANELFGTLIRNEQLATMQRSWFDFIWKESKTVR